MRDLTEITALQADLLEILWDAGAATVAQTRDALGSDALARTTVATMLARMERYGWLDRVRAGKEYSYQPVVSRAQVRSAQVREMMRSLFPRDLPSLVSHALRAGDWDEEDLECIEALVREHRNRREAGR